MKTYQQFLEGYVASADRKAGKDGKLRPAKHIKTTRRDDDEDEIVENYVVKYHDKDGKHVNDSKVMSKDKAQQHADKGNKIDKVGGKYSVHKIDEKMDMKKADMGDVITDFQKSDAPQFKGKSKEKRRQMAIAAKMQAMRNEGIEEGVIGAVAGGVLGSVAGPAGMAAGAYLGHKIQKAANKKPKKEELSPKQKKMDKNKNGKIDGEDLAKLRNESAHQQLRDYGTKHGGIDKTDFHHVAGKLQHHKETGNPGSLHDAAKHIRNMDTDPRDTVMSIIKKHDPSMHKSLAHKAGLVHKEEAEQIDELSKDTLSSYSRKASNQAGSSLKNNMSTKKLDKRYAGIKKASEKLAEEKVTHADESSPGKGKALKDMSKSEHIDSMEHHEREMMAADKKGQSWNVKHHKMMAKVHRTNAMGGSSMMHKEDLQIDEALETRISGGKVPVGQHTLHYKTDKSHKYISNSIKERDPHAKISGKDGHTIVHATAQAHSSVIKSMRDFRVKGVVHDDKASNMKEETMNEGTPDRLAMIRKAAEKVRKQQAAKDKAAMRDAKRGMRSDPDLGKRKEVDEAVGTAAKHAGKTGFMGGKYSSHDHMMTMKNFSKVRDQRAKQRDAEHKAQDPKHAAAGYAKHMVDTNKAKKKAAARGVDASHLNWKHTNGVKRGKLPENYIMEDAEMEKREMMKTQLHFIKYAAEEIMEYIDMPNSQIEEWYQNKVSKACADFEGLHAYMEGTARKDGLKEATDNPPFTPDPKKKSKPQRNSDGSVTSPMSKAKQLAHQAMKNAEKTVAQHKEGVDFDEEGNLLESKNKITFHQFMGATKKKKEKKGGDNNPLEAE